MAGTHVFNPALWATGSSAASYAKAYSSAVQAGDLLWAFVWQNNAANTCTGVSDTVNGAWTQAFGPVRGDANNFNATLYGFYRKNAGAGTPTVTAAWSAAGSGGIAIGAVRGLGDGGEIDQYVAGRVVGPPTGYQLTSGALAQAGEAAVGMVLASAGPTTPLWTAAGNVDSVNFERLQVTVTADAAATTFGTTGSTSGTATMGAMFFRDVSVGDATPPDQSGAITIGTVTSTSIQMSWPAGTDNVAVAAYDVSKDGGSTWTALGNVLTYTWAGLTPSTSYALRVRPRDAAGNVDSTPLAATQSTSAPPVSAATITVPGLSAWTGTVQAALSVPNVVVVRRSDRAQVLALVDQVADSSGNLVITDAALSAGVGYMVFGFTADGASSFRRAVTAA